MNAVSVLVFALAGVLLLVAFLPPLARRLAVPDSVLLAALGCIIGIALSIAGGGSAAPIGGPVLLDFIAGLGEIELSSELFLAVFLPLLLFETALRLDARALVDDVGPILVMAVLAVVVTTIVAGGALAAASSLPLAGALLVAAIIATTDPVAVVAVFRDVGAPARLTRLVEGESLLNDAAAIALFGALVATLAQGLAPDPLGLGLSFIWQFAGGGLFGAAIGWIAALALARLDEGGPAEVTLSVALAYLVFAAGEAYLEVSGVVAVVAAGLVYGDSGRVRLMASSWQTLLAIWEQIAFWASSLIFVLAATAVPGALREAGPGDLVLLAVLTAGALLARALVIYLVLPLAVGAGERRRIHLDHKLVMLWGGLRGAVTLALVLGVEDNPAVPAEVRHAAAVLATGFVLFTLLVQATTLRPLIRRLHLDRLGPVESVLRQRALEVTRAEVADRLAQMAAAIGGTPAAMPDAGPPQAAASEELSRAQLVSALATATRLEIQLSVEQQARGIIARRPGSRLVAESRALLDALRAEGLEGYRRVARSQGGFDRTTALAARWHRRSGRTRPLATRLAARVVRFLVRRDVLHQVQDFNQQRVGALFGARIAELAGRLIQARLDDIERGLDAIRLQYPDYWQKLTGRYLERAALELERAGLARMAQEGLLSAAVRRDLLAHLAARERAAEAVPDLDLGLDVRLMVRELPLLADLSVERLDELAGMLRPRLALPGERLLKRGSPGEEMYFIASGAVEVVLGSGVVRLGSGDFVGELALITRQPRAADVLALSYCQLLVLRREDFRRFLRAHPELIDTVRKIASDRAGRALSLEP